MFCERVYFILFFDTKFNAHVLRLDKGEIKTSFGFDTLEETGYNFTEVQRMINDYFFSDDKNLDEVFGEAEDVEDDEEE